mmetsp:Transcript_53235/g.171738  ORF Transcript_53235/g.171738 Transcript_53235/m.171738 type:complete len:105 (-) Transcript_53235:134-448(-)
MRNHRCYHSQAREYKVCEKPRTDVHAFENPMPKQGNTSGACGLASSTLCRTDRTMYRGGPTSSTITRKKPNEPNAFRSPIEELRQAHHQTTSTRLVRITLHTSC